MRVCIACLRLRLLILFSSDFRVSDKKRMSDLSVGMLDFQLISDLTCWRPWLTASKKALVFYFFFYSDWNTESTMLLQKKLTSMLSSKLIALFP